MLVATIETFFNSKSKKMKERKLKKALLALSVSLLCNLTQAQDNRCDVPDIGILQPHEFKTKTSFTNIWQGALGGINTKNSDRIIGLYDFDLYYLLSAESAKEVGCDYTLIVASLQSSFGHGLRDSKVGSFFEINDAAKGDNVLIDKLYVEFTAFDRLLTLDIGKIEIKDLFDSSTVAHCEKSQFLAEPFVHNLAVPWPKHGLGARVLWEPSDYVYAQAAIGDAQADKREIGFRTAFHNEDAFFSIAEVGVRPNFLNLPGTYRFIMWYDPQAKSYLDDSSSIKRDDLGFAVSFDQKMNQKTTAFFRYGWADDKVNELENFISFGGQVEGLIEGRERDIFAMGYIRGNRSSDGLLSQDERQIDLIEAYYNIKVNDNLSIAPNVQFVMNPGGLKDESAATVFGVRCRYKF